jgi:hypothetical protein
MPARFFPVVLPALIIVAVTIAWMLCMPRALLIGDDLFIVASTQHANWFDTLVQGLTTNPPSNKYRPVLTTIFALTIPVFGTNFYAYVALNTVVEIAAALTLASIVLRLTRRNAVLATLAGCAFVVSRFVYYDVIQIYGIMEGLALLLMLCALRAVVIAYQERRPAVLWHTVWLAALAIFTDERYLAMTPFLIAAPLLYPDARLDARRLRLQALAQCAAPLAYVFIKTVVFRAPVASGTGGHELALQPIGLRMFIVSAVENMLGFNAGPSYLSGRDLGEVGTPAYLAGWLVCVPILLVLGWYAADVIRRRVPRRPLVLALVLFVPLLLTTIVTIRQEFRWLYGPFALVVVAVAAAGGRYGARSVPAALAAFALIASAGGAMYYRRFAPNVFFIHAMAVAGSVRDALMRDPSRTIDLVIGNDDSIPHWALGEGTFFQVYGLDQSHVRFVRTVADAASDAAPADVLAVDSSAAGVVPLPMPTVVVAPFHDVRFSFESEFSKGHVEPARDMPTPGGRGAFLFPYAGETAGASSLTVVPGFRCTYRNVPVERDEHLKFYIARTQPGRAAARAFVSVRDAGGSVDVFSALVPASDGGPVWRLQDVPLDRFAGRHVDVTFGVAPVAPNDQAWLAFAEPSLVLAPR